MSGVILLRGGSVGKARGGGGWGKEIYRVWYYEVMLVFSFFLFFL